MTIDTFAKRDPILGGWADGWDHYRDSTGFCVNCGSAALTHYALVPRDEARIYRQLVKGWKR